MSEKLQPNNAMLALERNVAAQNEAAQQAIIDKQIAGVLDEAHDMNVAYDARVEAWANPKRKPGYTVANSASPDEVLKTVQASQDVLGKREQQMPSRPEVDVDDKSDRVTPVYGNSVERTTLADKIAESVAVNPAHYDESLSGQVSRQTKEFMQLAKADGQTPMDQIQRAIDLAYDGGQYSVAAKLQNKLDARQSKLERKVAAQLAAEAEAEKLDTSKLDDHSKAILKLLNGEGTDESAASKAKSTADKASKKSAKKDKAERTTDTTSDNNEDVKSARKAVDDALKSEDDKAGEKAKDGKKFGKKVRAKADGAKDNADENDAKGTLSLFANPLGNDDEAIGAPENDTHGEASNEDPAKSLAEKVMEVDGDLSELSDEDRESMEKINAFFSSLTPEEQAELDGLMTYVQRNFGSGEPFSTNALYPRGLQTAGDQPVATQFDVYKEALNQFGNLGVLIADVNTHSNGTPRRYRLADAFQKQTEQADADTDGTEGNLTGSTDIHDDGETKAGYIDDEDLIAGLSPELQEQVAITINNILSTYEKNSSFSPNKIRKQLRGHGIDLSREQVKAFLNKYDDDDSVYRLKPYPTKTGRTWYQLLPRQNKAQQKNAASDDNNAAVDGPAAPLRRRGIHHIPDGERRTSVDSSKIGTTRTEAEMRDLLAVDLLTDEEKDDLLAEDRAMAARPLNIPVSREERKLARTQRRKTQATNRKLVRKTRELGTAPELLSEDELLYRLVGPENIAAAKQRRTEEREAIQAANEKRRQERRKLNVAGKVRYLLGSTRTQEQRNTQAAPKRTAKTRPVTKDDDDAGTSIFAPA